MTSEDEVKNLIRRTIELYRSVDIVVNNAAPTTLIPDEVGELSTENWEDIHRRVVTSAFLVSKYAIPMLVLGGQGSIVNLSSESARPGYPLENVHACLPYGEAADLAAGVVYLGSDEAKFVTGSSLDRRWHQCDGTIPNPEVVEGRVR